jgi:hypothetical protein
VTEKRDNMEVNKMPEKKGIMYELLNVDADKVVFSHDNCPGFAQGV